MAHFSLAPTVQAVVGWRVEDLNDPAVVCAFSIILL